MTRSLTILALVLVLTVLPVGRIQGSAGGAAGGTSAPQGQHVVQHGRLRPRAALTHQPTGGVQHATVRVAVTVDDLPGGGPEVLGYTHVQIVKDIVATLQAHHVTHATGFVVGSMLETRPETREALDAWVQAGFEVGNHTYSHSKVEELGLEGYMRDVVANRPVVDALEKRTGQRHSYFRFPYLEEGRTEAERKALRRLLADQHYTLARVSLRFADTDWADAYLRCLQRGDSVSLDALRQSYLDNAMAELGWSVVASRQVFGHAIPQVLLLHANVATARNLDALLTAYERAGVRYISLESALREPAYTASYPRNGENLFDQASHSLGRAHPPDLVDPLTLIDVVCR